MKINKLSLKNFRGAEEMTLDFHDSMNIFFGANGYGKSTVLDAIAVMLSWGVNRLRTLTAYGQGLTVNQLSDGEKCLIAMIADLARRMAIANPVMKNPLEGNGIVLIDEIDLHLHSEWQRMIITKLNDVFPNCQFIISTHSPHVLTHVEPEKLYLLKQAKTGIVAERPVESYGKNVNRVLEDLMGMETTRPDKVFSHIKDIFDHIHNNDLEQARQMIKDVRKKIGEDPELLKAEMMIKQKELIGK